MVKEKKAACINDTVVMSLTIPTLGRGSMFLKNGYLKVEDHYFHRDEYCING